MDTLIRYPGCDSERLFRTSINRASWFHHDGKTRFQVGQYSLGASYITCISKFKAFGDLSYNTFPKLYDSIVWSTISYGAAIGGGGAGGGGRPVYNGHSE